MLNIRHVLLFFAAVLLGCELTNTSNAFGSDSTPPAKNEITVNNRGIPGATSRVVIARSGELFANRPSHVFIMLGLNDALNSQTLVSVDEYSRNMTQLVSLARAGGANSVTLITLHPVNQTYLSARHPEHP